MSHATSSGWAVRVDAVRPVAAGAIAWQSGDRWSLTVMVKATFSIVEEGLAELIAPAALCMEERFAREGAPSSPIEEPDLAPYKPQVDVTFVGSVHAPHPVQALRARIAVAGSDRGIDKSVQIVGDRVGASAAPRPFRQMQLGWERTWGSPDNPIGVTAGSLYQPNVVDPANPSAAVGLGPIARSWASRARLLGSLDPRWIDARTPHLPQGFAWEFFQAAPRDQRMTRLTGSETLLLENLLEGQPRMRTRLPSARGCARLHAPWAAAEGQTLDLAADTLKIDGDVHTVSIVWRASVPLPHGEASLRDAQVVAGVELPGFPMPWPSPRSLPGARRESSSAMQAVARQTSGGGAPAARASSPGHARISSSGLPRVHDDDDGAEGTALLQRPAAAPAGPPLSPPSAPVGGTLALTPEDAQRLLASAPRHAIPHARPEPVVPNPLARSPAATMPSPGEGSRRGLDPPTRPLPIAVIAAPPPPPAPEEATRQMSVASILADEITHASLAGLAPSQPESAPSAPSASQPQSQSTMALTPEQAAAMLASVGRHSTPHGAFPQPLAAPPLGPPATATPARVPPMVKQETLPSASAVAARGGTPPPATVEDVDTSGETFALTPEQAQRMIAEAQQKNRR